MRRPGRGLRPCCCRTSPLYWLTAARPLSDIAGLAAALASRRWSRPPGSRRARCSPRFLPALAAGMRSQVVWLTVPMLMLAVLCVCLGQRQRAALARDRGLCRWRIAVGRAAHRPVRRTGSLLAALRQSGRRGFTRRRHARDRAVAAAACAGAVLRAARAVGAWQSARRSSPLPRRSGRLWCEASAPASSGCVRLRSVLRLRSVVSGNRHDAIRLAARRTRSAFLAVRGFAAVATAARR